MPRYTQIEMHRQGGTESMELDVEQGPGWAQVLQAGVVRGNVARLRHGQWMWGVLGGGPSGTTSTLKGGLVALSHALWTDKHGPTSRSGSLASTTGEEAI